MRIPVDYPTALEEHEIVERSSQTAGTPMSLLSTEDVAGLQRAATDVYVDKAVQDYAIRLVLATRHPSEHGVKIDGLLSYGASPRASIGLISAGRSLALLRGRDHLLPQDVYDISYDVLNHRLVLSFDAVADGVTVDDVLVEVLTTVVAPRLSSSQLAASQASLVG
jgi:MoxR-like ATPase